MQCWKIVVCAAALDAIGVTAFIRQGSEVMSDIEGNLTMNPPGYGYDSATPPVAVRRERRHSSSNFVCLDDATRGKLPRHVQQVFQNCVCIVACKSATLEVRHPSYVQHEYVCLSSMCAEVDASKDGWAYWATGKPKLFWSKNSWMTAPLGTENDKFPDQTSKTDTWFNRLIGVPNTDLKAMQSMIAFMKVTADKLEEKGYSLYLDFCDVNPVCHGFGQAEAEQWLPNRKHQKIVMADLAQGVTKADYVLPNYLSNGPYCGAEFAKAKMMGKPILQQLPEAAHLDFGRWSFASMVMNDPNPDAAMTGLVNRLVERMQDGWLHTGAAAAQEIENNFDKRVNVPRNPPVVVPGTKILDWAEKVLEECEDPECLDDPTAVP